MKTISINNTVSGLYVVLAVLDNGVMKVQNSASDPLVPKLRELLGASEFSQLELRIDGQSAAEQHFEQVRQNLIGSLESTIEQLKTSSLR